MVALAWIPRPRVEQMREEEDYEALYENAAHLTQSFSDVMRENLSEPGMITFQPTPEQEARWKRLEDEAVKEHKKLERHRKFREMRGW